MKNNKSGFILLAVLWALVILTMLALSLGRSTNIDLALTKHAIGKSKAKYLAWAGIAFAVEQIRFDSQDDDTKNQDTLYQCAVTLDEDTTLEDRFKNHSLESGYFDIVYPYEENGISYHAYGMQDEERKININTLTPQNVKVFVKLLEVISVDEEIAQTIAYAVLDWKDEDINLSHELYGAEDDYYQSAEGSYKSKNAPFDSIEELTLVRGVDADIFKNLRNFITVYPQTGNLKINFNTASSSVLLGLAKSVSGPLTNTEDSDADSLVEKIIEYRRGEDGTPFTRDDRLVELNKLPLNAKERVLSLAMNQYKTNKSEFIRVRVKGVERTRETQSVLEAVIRRSDLTIVEWLREN